jgi:hypothetical protein
VWTFPIIETIHLLSLALSVGTILFVDLRLIGAGMRRQPVSEVMRRLQPWALGGFAMSFLTGGLLFWSEPLKCYNSQFFLFKLILLLVLGTSALTFHRTVYRGVARWDQAAVIPLRAKARGLCLIDALDDGHCLGSGHRLYSPLRIRRIFRYAEFSVAVLSLVRQFVAQP